tara:strand:- start:46 stop:435 length:390 start_codon:yes stop_codon:yes gene_type:complete
MSGMHLLPVYYTTTSSRKRKKQKKSKSLLVAEQEHAKYLKRMGVGKSNGGRSSVGRASGLQPEGRRFDPARLHQTDKVDTSRWTPCTKEDKSYKLDISNQYVIGQAYNKGGLQVLSKTEQSDPTTGKRR